MKVAVVDIESLPIAPRPDYPPRAVGVAVSLPGRPGVYYAHGHPSGNNATQEQAANAIRAAYACDAVVFHNANFDLETIQHNYGIAPPQWSKVHDTMHLLFLYNPHWKNFGLKSVAATLLGEPPSERDAVVDWLLEHQPVKGVRLGDKPKGKHYAGAYVAHAPAPLVGRYAIGDIERTRRLLDRLYPEIVERHMLPAYQREQELRAVLLACEQRGVCVDVERMAVDVPMYVDALARLGNWITKQLGVGEFNINSPAQLAKALLSSGKVTHLPLTATGEGYSTDKKALENVKDIQLRHALLYRAHLKTCVNTFLVPWFEMAQANNGRIYTRWNQLKGDGTGARTGRLSSSPNFQNIPKPFGALFGDAPLPAPPIPLPSLPLLRSYIIPSPGYVFIDRDYSQQEVRILAHFDQGSLLTAYNENPWLDIHDYAQAELKKMGLDYERRAVKNTNFGLMYGMGVGKLAATNEMTVEEAGQLKRAVLSLYPGLREMYDEMRLRARNKMPIRTWGGREYYCEPPVMVNGRVQEYDYKLVNVLIQGSAADCTKQAINQWARAAKEDWHLLINVHDELLCEVPAKQRKSAMKVLKRSMESVTFDLPMLTEGAYSSKNWAELVPTDTKGENV